MKRFLGKYAFFFAGGMTAVAAWVDTDHYWLWIAGVFALSVVGEVLLPEGERAS